MMFDPMMEPLFEQMYMRPEETVEERMQQEMIPPLGADYVAQEIDAELQHCKEAINEIRGAIDSAASLDAAAMSSKPEFPPVCEDAAGMTDFSVLDRPDPLVAILRQIQEEIRHRIEDVMDMDDRRRHG